MQYKRFIINNYRGIIEPLEISVHTGKPVALLGLNESGKSTILDAIFAFDYQNDNLNEIYNQLEDTKNLYSRDSQDARISALIKFEKTDFDKICSLFTVSHLLKKPDIDTTDKSEEEISEEINIKQSEAIHDFIDSKIVISRNISPSGCFYTIDLENKIIRNECFNLEQFDSMQNDIAKKILEHLPTMIYVTEFAKFLEEITLNPTVEILKKEKEYRDLFNNLFLAATKNKVGLDAFAKLTDAREYGPVKEDVVKFLNKEFTKRWEKFSIEHNFSKIYLDLLLEQNGKLKLVVYEEIDGTKYAFNISNRSSGFRWYFNFIMRTMFNPLHKNQNNTSTFYLMDEPGTFLHETSQKSLALELKNIIGENYLIYTTHHFQMINLTNISLNRIYIVEKANKLIHAYKTTDYQGCNDESKKAVISPILHSLRFTFLDLLREEDNQNKKFLLVEGLHDFYFITLFVLNDEFKDIIVWPSVGASQIVSNLPEFRFYHKGVYALFDNDKAGLEALKVFVDNTGYDTNAFVLPFEGNDKTFTMNNMFSEKNIEDIYQFLINHGVEVYKTYKSIMECLYENQNLLNEIKLDSGFDDKIKKLKQFIVNNVK